MKNALITGTLILVTGYLGAQDPTGTISMNYVEEECYVYLTSVASWDFQADTSGLAYVTIAVCENPDDLPFVLLTQCDGFSDTLPVAQGANHLSLSHEMRLRKRVPYTSGLWQRYKLDNDKNIFVFDNGMGVAGSIQAYDGIIPGLEHDTLVTIVYDTVEIHFTIVDTIRVYDTITISDTIYVAKEQGSGMDDLPPDALKMIIRTDEIIASFVFDDAEVYDLNGKLLIKVFNTNTIPMPGLSPGIYILKARVNNRHFQTRFMKS